MFLARKNIDWSLVCPIENEQFQPVLLDKRRTEISERAWQGHVGVYRYIVSSEETTLSFGVIASLARINSRARSSDVFNARVFSGRGGDHLSLRLPLRIEQELGGGFSIRYQPSVGGVYSYYYNTTKFRFAVFDQVSIVYSWNENDDPE